LTEIIVSLEDLVSTEYGLILCYPKYDRGEVERRIGEMRKLGVRAVCFSGNKVVAGLPVLGKGYVGIVVLALLEDGRRAALKISRIDSKPNRIIHEARMISMANRVGVGPKILGYTSNLLMMEYIEGHLLPEWIMGIIGDRERGSRRLRWVLRDILEQCWRLDSIGLDHGELSWADKHIIVDGWDRPHIIDFEAASDGRRTSNVTSISQYLFVRGRMASLVANILGHIEAERLIQALRTYKMERSRENFESILKILGLLELDRDSL